MSISRRSVIKAGGGAALYSALASMGFFCSESGCSSCLEKRLVRDQECAGHSEGYGHCLGC